MNKRLYFLLIPFLIITSCSKPGMELPSWLEGEWKTGNEAGFAGEVWEIDNDTLLQGQGLVLIGNTVHVMEEISIYTSNGAMYYGARVADQNEGKTILFKATYIESGHLVFENPGHDFPTRIVYKLAQPDTLEVNISGRDKEDTRTIIMHKHE